MQERGLPMVVGVATISLELPTATSLKDKRSVVRRLSSRLRARFNVAVAEVEELDYWGKATLAVVCVSNDGRHARSMLDSVVRAVDDMRIDAVLFDVHIELL
jgi:uncharacterized protein YlxP (DUF503 family)